MPELHLLRPCGRSSKTGRPRVGATEREEWGYDRGTALSVAAKAGLSNDVRAGDGIEGVLELRRTREYLEFFLSGFGWMGVVA
ncbi:hypothetical protein EUGRSUZ_H05114 [Eucalyptus grandis]|uniref:Uncharacterized protein n=2 Tax=Eucalyptus grandis TaxID=71139 RepID=A0ACC3JZ76_EUCGR|nr:hypothetical protein EUGRSUZ_H05114 [Eucalyptus grandis]